MEHINRTVSFGKNETFFLKYNWTYKSLSALKANNNFFNKTNSYLDLGVGKNMLASIKYWMGAYQILDENRNSYSDKISEMIFNPDGGLDPFIEREETLWIMHWRLCSNYQNATLYYWFFNKFKSTRFTKDELTGSLYNWLSDNTSKKISSNTIERDVNLLLKTYATKNNESESLEDNLENPFSNLELIHKNSDGSYTSVYKHRDSIDHKMLAFFILKLLEDINKKDLFTESENSFIPLIEIIDSSDHPSLRNMFKLSENYLMQLIENMVQEYSKYFDLSETAGQRNIIIKDNDFPILKLLKDIYS